MIKILAEFWSEDLNVRGYLEVLDLDKKIIIRWILKKKGRGR